ncbi:hypothetical protein MRX96_047162 [Rhipicephalus microplus]
MTAQGAAGQLLDGALYRSATCHWCQQWPAGCLATFHSHLPGQQPTTLGVPAPHPCPCLIFVVYDGPQRRVFAEPEPALIVGVDTGNHQSNCHRRPSARGAAAGTCVETWRRTGGFGQPQSSHLWCPRLIQPKQPQILPKLSSGSANMTKPSAAATTRSQSPRADQHKATPRPAPVPAPQPATTVQRGAAMGLNTGSPLLIGNPAAAQPGMFPAGPAHGTFLLNQYIPGLGHSPILIQGTLGQTQSSLGQIQGVQLALRPPHATGLTLGPQTGPRPHEGNIQDRLAPQRLSFHRTWGQGPTSFWRCHA